MTDTTIPATLPILSPCPLCGGDDVRVETHEHSRDWETNYVVCDCGAEGPAKGNRGWAIALWNRRAQAPAQEALEALRAKNHASECAMREDYERRLKKLCDHGMGLCDQIDTLRAEPRPQALEATGADLDVYRSIAANYHQAATPPAEPALPEPDVQANEFGLNPPLFKESTLRIYADARVRAAMAAAAVREPLTPEQQHALWKKVNALWATDDADFKAGIRLCEAAHGITAKD